MNRLLEVYSRVRDRERPQLSSASTDVRREAIVTLGALAPLSAPELSQALNDSSAELRIRAAQALAVHGLQFLRRDPVHAHARAVEHRAVEVGALRGVEHHKVVRASPTIVRIG